MKTSLLVESGIFPDESNATYAIATFNNLKKPNSSPLLTLGTEKNIQLKTLKNILLIVVEWIQKTRK